MKPIGKELKIWEYYYENELEGKDSFGSIIKKNSYKDKTKFGWTIDHIWPKNPKNPKAPKGSEAIDNTEPMHWKNNQIKKRRTKNIKINGKKFSIIEYTRDEKQKAIGEIIEIKEK